MKQKIKTILITLLTFLALGFNVPRFLEVIKNMTNPADLISSTYSGVSLGLLGSALLIFFLFKLYQRPRPLKSKVINFLSIIFAIFMIFGESYMYYGNMHLIFKSAFLFLIALLRFTGFFYLFQTILSYLFHYFNNYKKKDYPKKIFKYFKDHPFKTSLIFILLCWSPYIIAFYPIILSPDPSFQIRQFFGIRTKYADYAPLLSEKMQITNHHPVVHTLLIGTSLYLGHLIGNDNLGLFLYSLIQITIFSTILAYSIKYMIKDMHISTKYALTVLLIYALVPSFPLYAMSGVKDVIFSSFVLLYIITLHKILKKSSFTFKNCLTLITLMLLIILFRNNGIYLILLSFPFLILARRKIWKPLLISLLITIGLSTTITKVIYPYFKITPGSIREMLSIPFQQTARYVKYHSEELSQDDIAIIDKVLGYKDLASRYEPELSDKVKNGYNKYTTKEDLKSYFIVWLKGLLKEPATYIDATITNTYGYFYPEKTSWYVYHNFDKRITENGFKYHYNNLNITRSILSSYAESFPYLPVIGLLVNIAFNTWLVFILAGYSLYQRKYSKLILYLPALVSILVCIAGPANTYYRYALPYIMSMPLMISFVLEKEK